MGLPNSGKVQKQYCYGLEPSERRRRAVETTVKTILQNRVKSEDDLPGIEEIDAYIAQFFHWVREFTQYPFQIMQDLADISGDSSTKLRVLVPTLIDQEFWLRWSSKSEKPTSPRDQAELVYLIVKSNSQEDVSCQASFRSTPWRYMNDLCYKIRPNAFDVIQDAVTKYRNLSA